MNQTLTAYFSATGNTREVARAIAAFTGSTLYEIKPAAPYSEADLNWQDAGSRSSLEMKDVSSRPAMAGQMPDLEKIKTIFLGFPIWWYEAPRIIYSFLDNCDLTGKALVPFVTSGSSGLGRIPEILQSAYPKALWLPGTRFSQHPEIKSVEEWVSEHTDWKK